LCSTGVLGADVVHQIPQSPNVAPFFFGLCISLKMRDSAFELAPKMSAPLIVAALVY